MDSPPERAPLPPRHRAPGGARDEPNMAPPCLRSCFSLPAASPQAAERQAATSQVQSGGATTRPLLCCGWRSPAAMRPWFVSRGRGSGRAHPRAGGSKARTSAAPRTPGAAPRCARRRRRRRPGEVRAGRRRGGRWRSEAASEGWFIWRGGASGMRWRQPPLAGGGGGRGGLEKTLERRSGGGGGEVFNTPQILFYFVLIIF